jgi:hypothetical protein
LAGLSDNVSVDEDHGAAVVVPVLLLVDAFEVAGGDHTVGHRHIQSDWSTSRHHHSSELLLRSEQHAHPTFGGSDDFRYCW